MAEKVVHCKKHPYDVYIGRPSKWGNPIKLNNESERENVIREYVAWLSTQPNLQQRVQDELNGKVLGCWCAPKLCHGDILTYVATGMSPNNALRQVLLDHALD